MSRVLIIPAAGTGSRLGAPVPKLLVAVNGRPMIDRLFDRYRPFVDAFVLVVHPSASAAVRAHCAQAGLAPDLVEQPTPTGMLDAILLARERVLARDPDQVWITWCDQIAVTGETVAALDRACRAAPTAPLILPIARRANPYTHLARLPDGRIGRILHRREGNEMPPVGDSEMGLFSLSRHAYDVELLQFSAEARLGEATGERNFLPFIPWMAGRGDVVTFDCADPMESMGINTPEELAQVSAWLAAREASGSGPAPRVLSIIIPAYNEERFIGTLLERIAAVDLAPLGISRELIVVDDCSKDRTGEIAAAFPGVVLKRHEKNAGKGRAVRTGLAAATGEFVIIQDADLEYDPRDYVPMLRALLEEAGDIVYGSRYTAKPGSGRFMALVGTKHPAQSWGAYLGGRSLSFICWLFTGRYLTDTVTALKLFRRDAIARLDLETTGFELDHEITARMLARGYRIAEVPIRYYPRSRQEGKKIGLKDWFIASRTFARYRRG